MRCELSLQPLSAIQPFPESRPLLEAVQAGSNVWDEGALLSGSFRQEQPDGYWADSGQSAFGFANAQSCPSSIDPEAVVEFSLIHSE